MIENATIWKFPLFVTGHKLGPAIGWKYLGTIQEVSLGLVWHLFEE